MISTSRVLRVLAVGLIPAFAACAGEDADTSEIDPAPGAEITAEAVRVTAVDLGSAIDVDRRIVAAVSSDGFAATDTVYASVATEGSAGESTLTARWTFEDGQVVDETSQTISPTGNGVTEFHISREGGLPAGSYQVEILLNGQSVEREDFEVRGS